MTGLKSAQRVTSMLLLMVSLQISACGKLAEDVGLTKKKKNESGAAVDGVLIKLSVAPAAFWQGELDCALDRGRNFTQKEFNKAGTLLREETCTWDPATRILTRSVKRASVNSSDNTLRSFEESSWSESTWSAGDLPLTFKRWTSSSKVSLESETEWTYDAAGSLTTSKTTRNFGVTNRRIETVTWDANGVPGSQKTEYYEGDTLRWTEDSTCNFIVNLFAPRNCETTRDGTVRQRIVLEGSDWIESGWVGGQLVEVQRSQPLANSIFDVRLRRNNYKGTTTEIESVEQRACNSEFPINCSDSLSDTAGNPLLKLTTVYKNFATAQWTVGPQVYTFKAPQEVSGTFEGTYEYWTATGTFESVVDAATLNHEDKVSVTFNPGAGPAQVNDEKTPSFGLLPPVEDFMASSARSSLTAETTVTVRASVQRDTELRETLWQINELTGVAENQINVGETFKRETMWR